MDYQDFAEEFGRLVPEWARLEGYVTDAIVRDGLSRFTEFEEYWENYAIGAGTSPIYAFVRNYIEVVEKYTRHPMFAYPSEKDIWMYWGTTLRLLEIDH